MYGENIWQLCLSLELARYAVDSLQMSVCCTDILVDYLNHPLDYRKNFTVCDDGTVCPTSFPGGSDICCNTHKGRTEINYHNPVALPYASSDLSGELHYDFTSLTGKVC